METIKLKTRTFTETEFSVPKYFKISNHYYMIIDEINYLLVKSTIENSLTVYPEISILGVEWSSGRWLVSQMEKNLIPITEQEFRDEYTKANVLLLNYLN